MKRITITVTANVAEALKQLVADANTDVDFDTYTTHGQLTVSRLLGMLAEDAALVVTRPGCWEAANMYQVLSSHGYQL